MCGIIAIQELETPTKDPKQNVEALIHLFPRGPDAMDYIQLEKVFLGFTRLSINDLSDAGMQPMKNEDSTVWLICNGEIFNHKDIQTNHHLQSKSKSDCEVILHLYMKYRDMELEFSDWILQLDGC